MIVNIVDHRSNSYNVRIDAVFEPSQHDNSIEGATKFSWGAKEFCYDDMCGTTIVEAIEYANNRYECPTTLFMYDEGVMSTEKLR